MSTSNQPEDRGLSPLERSLNDTPEESPKHSPFERSLNDTPEESPKHSPFERSLNDTPEESPKHSPFVRELISWLKPLISTVLITLLFRGLVMEPFKVEGASMMPTFTSGERIFVTKIIYDIEAPSRGDVVVFHANKESDYIKRVVAVAGDTISVRDDVLYVNGKPVDEPYIESAKTAANAAGFNFTEDIPEMTVPPNQVYVLGDNRQNSSDSRIFGTVPVDEIVGRVDFVYLPIANARTIP